MEFQNWWHRRTCEFLKSKRELHLKSTQISTNIDVSLIHKFLYSTRIHNFSANLRKQIPQKENINKHVENLERLTLFR